MNRFHAKAERLMIARERKERQDSLNRMRQTQASRRLLYELYDPVIDDEDPCDDEYHLLHS
jgi:hypothetical protein